MANSIERRTTANDGVSLPQGIQAASEVLAPRIALIHSLAMDHMFWNPVADLVAGEIALLALDCCGHGRSGRPIAPFTVERMADDLAAALGNGVATIVVSARENELDRTRLASELAHPGSAGTLVKQVALEKAI